MKKNEVKSISTLIIIAAPIYAIYKIVNEPLFGIFLLLVIASIVYFLVSGGIRDRRFKSGYKNNQIPTSLGKRLLITLIGLVLSVPFYILNIVYGDKSEAVINKVASEDKAVITAKDGLNLRTDASLTKSEVVMVIPAGDTVNVLQTLTSDIEWNKVEYRGSEGWLSAKYIKRINEVSFKE